MAQLHNAFAPVSSRKVYGQQSYTADACCQLSTHAWPCPLSQLRAGLPVHSTQVAVQLCQVRPD